MVKRSKDESRAEIVSSAKRLFQQYGYKKTTVSDIAKAMGKVKSAIYYYFPDKESLLRAVIDEEIGKLIRSIKDAVERAQLRKKSLEYTLSLEALKLDA